MNPFSSRFIRPGARRYLFPPNESINSVLERLVEKRIVQIVGPHGSGKSTLVEMICQSSDYDFAKVVISSSRPKNEAFKEIRNKIEASSQDKLLVIDGIEQLKVSQRSRIIAKCKMQKLLLLVTTHVSVGVDTLMQTSTSFNVFRQIVDEMLNERLDSVSRDADLIETTDIEWAFKNSFPDLREALFELYDVFERRRAAV